MQCVWNCQRVILSWFYNYGYFLAKHPFCFLIIPLVICGGLAVGFIAKKENNDIEYLYAPSKSRSIEEREIVELTFDDKSNYNYSPFSLNRQFPKAQIIFRSKQEHGILTKEVIEELTLFYRKVVSMNVTVGAWNMTYDDVCKKQRGQCVIYGSFVFEDGFLDKVTAGNVTFPYWTETPGVDMALVFAKETLSGSKSLLSAGSFKITFTLTGSAAWESAFVDLVRETKFTTVDIAYGTSNSMGEELNKGTKGDIMYFALTFTLMITFASIVSSGGDCVTSRMLLANAGVLAVAFGIIGAIGLVNLCGVEFVNIVGTMPFLTLGIGVDDMFLLMSSWSETLPLTDLTIPERIGTVYKKAGIGITITSVTDFLAFAIGASSRFRSVRNFCIYTGVAVLLCYICNACVFGACLTLHARRVYASRHSITCRKARSRKQLKEDGASCCRIHLCGGEIPTTSDADQSVCEWGPRKVLVRLLLWNPMRYLTLVAFAGYLAVAIWGCTKLKQGLELKNLAPQTSYFYKFQSWDDEDFGTKLPISFVTTAEKDYSKPETLQDTSEKTTDAIPSCVTEQESPLQFDPRKLTHLPHSLWSRSCERDSRVVYQEMKQLLDKAQEDPFITPNISVCWLTELARTNLYNTTSQEGFHSGLLQFLSLKPSFKNDVVIGVNSTAVSASRCHVYSRKVTSSSDQADIMSRMREVADASPAGVFAFHPAFVVFEQFVVIVPDTLQTVGVTIGVMFVATCIFLPHPLMVIIVTVQVFMIVVGIFGFLAHWDLTLSSITMIELIMSVGFSVDFCAHVCTAYMISEEQSKQDRAKDAIIHASSPIFNGAMSSIIGLIMLLFTQSYIFQAFFKIMLLVIGFGVLHAVFLVPVVLSFIGPSAHVRLDQVSPPDLKNTTNQHDTTSASSSHKETIADKTDKNSIDLVSFRGKQDSIYANLNPADRDRITGDKENGWDESSSEMKANTARSNQNLVHVASINGQPDGTQSYVNNGYSDESTMHTKRV